MPDFASLPTPTFLDRVDRLVHQALEAWPAFGGSAASREEILALRDALVVERDRQANDQALQSALMSVSTSFKGMAESSLLMSKELVEQLVLLRSLRSTDEAAWVQIRAQLDQLGVLGSSDLSRVELALHLVGGFIQNVSAEASMEAALNAALQALQTSATESSPRLKLGGAATRVFRSLQQGGVIEHNLQGRQHSLIQDGIVQRPVQQRTLDELRANDIIRYVPQLRCWSLINRFRT